MNILIILGVGVLGAIAFFFSKRQTPLDLSSTNIDRNPFDTMKTQTKTPFEDLFRNAGLENDVEWELISAHAFVESTYNPKAHNVEGSKGLMQIFLPLARNKGAFKFVKDGVLPEWENIDESKLYDPQYNIDLGAALIRENIKEYGMPRAIACYNNFQDTGSSQFGPFVSQGYVNRVLKRYTELKGTA